MTELQWLIKMLTQHKLPTSLKDLFIERIGDVEATLNQPKPTMVQSGIRIPGVQAPSTQRILDEIEMAPMQQRVIVPQEVITGKGNGTSTRGPRKF